MSVIRENQEADQNPDAASWQTRKGRRDAHSTRTLEALSKIPQHKRNEMIKRGVEISLHGVRQASPPKMISIDYNHRGHG